MQLPLISCLFLLAACSPQAEIPRPVAAPASVALTQTQKAKIGQKIWMNESGGTVDGLTQWNDAEAFPSLGIGHFIWYPAGYNGPFTESFPQFISYAISRGANPPAVARQRHSPWRSKAQFTAAFRGAEMNGLRTWLAGNVSLQTDFIIAKSQRALGKILAATPAGQRAQVKRNYQKVSTTSNGTYALIDYVNFKGEGTNPRERYKGQGWGLAWVLREMRDVPAGQAAAGEFAEAAKRCLGRRIANASKNESRWRAGWFNRCDTYKRPL